MANAPSSTARHPGQTLARVIGALFLVIGILGFIPGITGQYDQMQFAGQGSGAMLFGLFQVSVLHNLVHIAIGLAGLTMARTLGGARAFLIGAGIITLALWLYGWVVDNASNANFVPMNTADNWLHLILGTGMVALGVAATSTRREAAGVPTDTTRRTGGTTGTFRPTGPGGSI
ncbi:MAG: DUF4383 domain-containing protein [Actinomycetota bacterium]|nr:DUF4383 domain-containing protein [Actinomycetota bacterium]